MEIERKFLVRRLPVHLEQYACHQIEQAYLCTDPVVRVRQEDDTFYLTYKGSGLMTREEYNLPLTAQSYAHLRSKADGNILTKKRYLIPLSPEVTAELDIFEGMFLGLILVETEFATEEEALGFCPPEWFGEDVTWSSDYHNSVLSRLETWQPPA